MSKSGKAKLHAGEKVKRAPEPRSAPSVKAPPGDSLPKVSAASLARRKAALLDELRGQEVTPARQLDIRSELSAEPMASTPILSYAEIQRLGD